MRWPAGDVTTTVVAVGGLAAGMTVVRAPHPASSVAPITAIAAAMDPLRTVVVSM
jgi:hypothetical protein